MQRLSHFQIDNSRRHNQLLAKHHDDHPSSYGV